MTKLLADALDMKSLDEILSEEIDDDMSHDIDIQDDVSDESALITHNEMKGKDHSRSMDEIYIESLEIAKKVVDMGMNIDPARAPRILEVANQWMKTAMDAKVSKRDSQLKLMRLINDSKKIDIINRKMSGSSPENSIDGDIIFQGDRNKLLEMLKKSETPDDK